MGKEYTAIQKLDYVYKYIQDPPSYSLDTALEYLEELANALDLLGKSSVCGGGQTIPME